MTAKKILVTGATGLTGGATAKLLLEKGHKVRALAHSQDMRSDDLKSLGAEVVFGDMLNLNDMRSAVKGVESAYFVYPVCPGLVEASVVIAQAAKEAELRIVANMSQKPARGNAPSPASINHWLSEQAFKWSGANVVHLRATFFAEWILWVSPMIRQGKMAMPWGPHHRHAPVAAADLARLTVGILENPKPHVGKVYPLHGPLELSYVEIAAIISKVIGKPVSYEQVSVSDLMKAFGRPNNAYLRAHLESVLYDYDSGIFGGTDNYISDIGGRQPLTVEEFVTINLPALV